MNERAQELLGEVRELMIQYRREVSGARRAWPEAIKSRVREIAASGVTPKDIAALSKLSYYTVLDWVPREQRRHYRPRKQAASSGHFAPIAVRPTNAISTVTVAQSRRAGPHVGRVGQNATVTVTLPNGIRLDGVTPEFLAAWLGAGARS